jgi:MFS transporter, SP family, galactose:H+ symporter
MAQGFSHVPVTHDHGDALVSSDARKRLRRWGAIAAIGGFLFGYDTGVISGALLFIKHDFDLGSFEQGLVVSVLLFGAMIGAFLASRPADRYGRRSTLAVIAVIYTVGIVAAAAAPSFGVLLGARFVMGLGVGAASAIVPLYLSEIAPSNVRGQLVSLNQLMITIGIVVSYLVDLIFASSEAWRAMFAIGAIPSILFLLGMLRMPETPAWLDARGREQDARAVLGEVTDDATVDEMISGYRKAREQAGAKLKLRQLARSGARPALIIGLVLAVVQQFGGINTIIYYAPTIMENTGLGASASIVSSLVIGVINVGMTVVSIRLIDKRGRRPLLLISLAGMIVTLILLGLTFALPLGAIDSYVALLCILLYIAAFAIGMGPVFWLLVSEVFPANARAEGVSVSGTANWLANFIIGLLFLPLIDAVGEGPTFWIFAAISVAGLLFVQRYVPETKGRSFAEVDRDVHARFGAA